MLAVFIVDVLLLWEDDTNMKFGTRCQNGWVRGERVGESVNKDFHF